MHKNIVRRPDCGVEGASEAYARLYDIVMRDYASYAPEKQAILLALAYTQYCAIKKDNIKDICDEPPKPNDGRSRTDRIRTAWKGIAAEKQLKDYLEMAERLLTQMLHNTQQEALRLINNAVDGRLDDVQQGLETIQGHAAATGIAIDNHSKQLAHIVALVAAQDATREAANKRGAIMAQDLRPFRVLVTKPLESVCVSVVVLGTTVLIATLVRLYSEQAIAKVAVTLQLLAKFLLGN